MVHSPIKPISNSTIQLSDAEFDLTAAPQSGRYEVENCVNKFRENRAYLLLGKVRPDQSDSAVYVVAHPARADQAFVIVSGCYAAYRKTVPFIPDWKSFGTSHMLGSIWVRGISELERLMSPDPWWLIVSLRSGCILNGYL